ncbi:2OG-Fe(II)-dependent halogenase WelO5 family protein [Streptomyces sp. URMC 126]|uniref:2OG-Fe(II)-dependent halogenase WelO5 family protein n=1 Tax=Streptomyces sp. URMC 126 TaxID=3423401 RepID=UPI003F1CBB9A
MGNFLPAAFARQGRQLKSSDPEELAAWAERLGSYPVVGKPMSSTGSDGVRFCADRTAVAAAARTIRSSTDLFGRHNAEVLVQERMDGTEYIVDVVSARGQRFLAGVWRYEKRMLGSGRRIYDKDVLLASDEHPAEELSAYVHTVLDALGIDHGAARAEVMMTESGPMLVEVAARMNGNSHPEFHSACMDANQADLVALSAVDSGAFIREYGGRKYRKRTEAVVHNASTTLNGEIEGFDIHADGVRDPLHNDNIMRDAAGTGIVLADLARQLSCVVCLQECDEGGELRIYRRPWEPQDETFKIDGGLGYDEGVVEGHPGHEFKPQAGDVYVINPMQYHSIEQVSGSDRITMGFFLGFADEKLGSAVVWG